VKGNSEIATMPYATGLTFSLVPGFNSQPCATVSRVLESSAANLAGIMVGDVLLQIDDRIVSGLDDVKRCVFTICQLFGELRSSMLTYTHI
jgi:S1-C subfamily serine protease